MWSCLATDIAFGPDGGLYISDWVDGWDGLGKGRIYRLHDPRQAESDVAQQAASLLNSDWSSRAAEELAADLSHADRRVRLEAQWQLAERSEHPTLLDIARDTRQPQAARLHAIWGVDQIARREANQAPAILASLRPLSPDPDPVIRAAVVKVLGERGDTESIERLTQRLKDPSPRVRYFAAISLGKLNAAAALPDVVAMLAAGDTKDPALRHAGILYLSLAAKASVIAKLGSHQNAAVRRAAVAALRRLKAGELMSFLNDGDPLVATEAARAIHDLPVPVAFNALAALIEQDLSNREFTPAEPRENAVNDAPLTRRVLNANYRLGTRQAADRLAKFATQISVPAALRIEALEMLAAWDANDPRDRILNDYRPLKPRSSKIAAAALEQQIDLLANAEESVREKMIDVASGLGIGKIVPMLARRVVDAKLRNDLRAAALIALARLDGVLAVKLARQVPLTPATPFVPAALKVIADHDKTASIETFIAATDSRDSGVRQLAWDILATINGPTAAERIQSGVRAYIDGTLPADVHLNVLEAANGKLSADVEGELSAHCAKLAESDPLAKWLASLHGGDVGKGAKLFFGKTELSCVRCHKVDRSGGEVGPNLTTIGKQRDARYLLEAICLPDAQIAKGYETTVIADVAGDVFTGIVKTETDDYVELVKADGSLQRVPQEEIEFRQRGQSAMPADLIKHLSDRELRDLVAYLVSLRVDPRAAADTE